MTDQTRAVTSAGGSEEQFRLLVEQAPIAVAVHRQGTLLYVNPAGARLIGATSGAELLGRSIWEFVHPAYRQRVIERVRQVQEQGRAAEPIDEQFVRLDGQVIDVEVLAIPTTYGDQPASQVVIQDVTARKRAEVTRRFLADVSEQLAQSLDVEPTLATIVRLVVPTFADWCALDLVDEQGRIHRLAAAHADPARADLARELARRYPPDPDADAGVPTVLRTGQTQFHPEIPDALPGAGARDGEHRELLRAIGVRSDLIVPLIAHGRTLGALTLVMAESGRRYTEDDRLVAEDLGRRAALAVDNARLYAAERQARTAAERLALITQQIGASLAPEVVLDQIAVAAVQLLGSSFAGVFLLEARTGDFVLASGHGLAASATDPLRLPRERSVAGRAIARRRTILVEDVAVEPGTALPALLGGVAIGSLVVAPIVAGVEPLGVIEVYATAPRTFGREAEPLLTGLAAAAAAALANARLYQDVQEQATAHVALNAALREAAGARDRALAEAEAERRRLHDLFQQAPAAIAETRGPEHVFTFANPLYLQFVGRRDPGALLGRPVREALPDLASHGYLALIDRVYQTGEPWVGNEVRDERRSPDDGTPVERFFNVVIQPVRDAPGQVVGLQAYATEVTDLVRARQRVEELAAERDAFLAAASHDLKNPLATIKATAQFLRRQLARAGGVEPERLASALANIEDSEERMFGLVSDLLDVARLRMGQQLELNRRPTDLVPLARRVVAAQQQTTDRHQLRLECSVGELVGEWDAARLGRVLSNLLDNAVKYSPQGGEVVVELAREDDRAVLRVRDRGIGIPAADRARVFEPFQRGSNVAGVIAGTGLGLAGAKQIVEQHGGTITVESAEGAGTTFTVRLPFAAGEGNDDG